MTTYFTTFDDSSECSLSFKSSRMGSRCPRVKIISPPNIILESSYVHGEEQNKFS